MKSMLSAHSIVYGGFDVNGMTFCAELFILECSHFIPVMASSAIISGSGRKFPIFSGLDVLSAWLREPCAVNFGERDWSLILDSELRAGMGCPSRALRASSGAASYTRPNGRFSANVRDRSVGENRTLARNIVP